MLKWKLLSREADEVIALSVRVSGGGFLAVIPAFRSRPTYQVTGALQALSLGRSKHTHVDTQTPRHPLQFMHSRMHIHTLASQLWHREIISDKNKNWHKSRIKCPQKWNKKITIGIRHIFWNWLRGLRNGTAEESYCAGGYRVGWM